MTPSGRAVRGQGFDGKHLAQPSLEGRRLEAERDAQQAVRRQHHETLLLHVGEERQDRSPTSAVLGAVRQRGLVAMVPVGDEDGLVRERRRDTRDRRRIGHAPHAVDLAARPGHFDEGRAPHAGDVAQALAGAGIHPEDGTQVGAGGPEQRELVALRSGEGALVRPHHPARELLEPEATEHAVALVAGPVGQPVLLRVEVEAGVGVAHQHPRGHPVAQRHCRRIGPLRLARQDEPHDVPGTALVERRLLRGRDHVVGRRDHRLEIDPRRVVAQCMEWGDDRHQSSFNVTRAPQDGGSSPVATARCPMSRR